MILFRIDKSTFEVYGKKIDSFYIIFLLKISAFLDPPKKDMAAVWMFSQRRIV